MLLLILFLLHCASAHYEQRPFPKRINIKDAATKSQKHGGYLRDPEEEVEQQVYKIGALFDQEDSVEEIALKLAIERFNLRNEDSGIKFKGQIDYVEGGSYFVDPKACEILQEGVVGIFGPQNHQAASHVQSICDAFEVPHIETRWDYDLRRELYLINLSPHPDALSNALQDLVSNLNWDRYIVLYEQDDGFVRLQGILQLSEATVRAGYFMKFPPGDDYRPFLYEVLDSATYDHFIIDCTPAKAYQILKQAQQVGLLNSKINMIFTTLDLATLDLEDFKYSRALILALRLVDPAREEIKEILRHWHQYGKSDETGQVESEIRTENIGNSVSSSYDSNSPSFYERFDIEHLGKTNAKSKDTRRFRRSDEEEDEEEGPIVEEEPFDGRFPEWFTTDVALIFDAVDLLGHALGKLGAIQDVEVPSLHCESSNSWQQGYSVINYMKMSHIQGLTGWIQFNTTGYRTDVGLEIVQLKETGLEKIGAWDAKFVNKIQWFGHRPSDKKESAEDDDGSVKPSILKGKTIKVTTILGEPMAMWKVSETPLTGNERFEGYAVELVQNLANMYGFEYEINPVGDGKYGGQNRKTGEWNGMVREVMDGVADIAVADLTVNKQRSQAIDLTMPFMTLGISILFVAPKAKPPSLLSFMAPMEVQVWLFVCAAIAGTTLTLFLCARVSKGKLKKPIVTRLSPYEWIVPHPCIDDPDELENEFTLRDSFFFVVGTYLCQGAAIAPKTASTRMVAGFWWLFTLIMVSSYTANLATFLIVQDLDESIKVLDDLPKQSKVKYGCLGGGTTATFFRTSPFETHKAVWKNMVETDKTDKVFFSSNKEGVQRVIKDAGRYAFFMESTVIEYNTERNCKLHQVGGLLDSKGYAIGLKKGSNYTQLLSSGILKFQEKGILDELKRKWWKEERKANACDDDEEEESSSVQPLTLANVGGVFIVLVVGCIVSIFISCYELIGSAMDLSDEFNTSFCSELGGEIQTAFSCKGVTKPVRKKEDSEKDEDSACEKSRGSKSSSGKRDSSESKSNSSKEKEILVTETLQIRYRNKKEP